VPEDASGDAFYYPVDTGGGSCVYKMSINENNPLMQSFKGLAEAGQFAESLGVQGLSGVNSVIKTALT